MRSAIEEQEPEGFGYIIRIIIFLSMTIFIVSWFFFEWFEQRSIWANGFFAVSATLFLFSFFVLFPSVHLSRATINICPHFRWRFISSCVFLSIIWGFIIFLPGYFVDHGHEAPWMHKFANFMLRI